MVICKNEICRMTVYLIYFKYNPNTLRLFLISRRRTDPSSRVPV
jgi:hypothetical protein